jgi:hypothetical protein
MGSLGGKLFASASEQAAGRISWAEGSGGAVAGEGKGAFGEGDGLVVEGVGVEVSVVGAVFVESSRDLGRVGGGPEVVVAEIAWVWVELPAFDHF